MFPEFGQKLELLRKGAVGFEVLLCPDTESRGQANKSAILRVLICRQSSTFSVSRSAMVKILRSAAALCALALVTACSSGSQGPAEMPVPPAEAPVDDTADPTTADGIFTAAQADRGEALFRSTCSECHDSADWTETGFKGRWEDQSVYQLWYYVNERMPYDDPWSLSRQQTTDVLTYIFRLNGLPAGNTELATDDDSIDDYWIAWSPSLP